jgi:hypothetical protein
MLDSEYYICKCTEIGTAGFCMRHVGCHHVLFGVTYGMFFSVVWNDNHVNLYNIM